MHPIREYHGDEEEEEEEQEENLLRQEPRGRIAGTRPGCIFK